MRNVIVGGVVLFVLARVVSKRVLDALSELPPLLLLLAVVVGVVCVMRSRKPDSWAGRGWSGVTAPMFSARDRRNPLRRRNQARLALSHEAGHAVALSVLGVRVVKMAVDGKGGGYTAYHRRLGRKAEVLVTLAGPLAEARYGKAGLRDALDLGAGYRGSDHDVVSHFGALDSAGTLRAWEKRTARLLKGREGEVAAVAAALGKRGTLSSRRIKQAIKDGRTWAATGGGNLGAPRRVSPWRTLPKAPAEENATAATRVSPWRRFT